MITKTKLYLIFSFLSITFSIVGYHTTESFYPIFPAVGVALCIGLFLLVFKGSQHIDTKSLVGLFILISLFYRLGLFLLPSSLLGVDAVKHAVQAQWVMKAGTTSVLPTGFYQKASLFQVFTAQTGIITGLRADHALIVYPLLIGISVPLIATVFVRRISVKTPEHQKVSIAGIIAISGVATNWYSVAPVAQILSIPLLYIVLHSTIVYFKTTNRMFLLVISVLASGMVFAHKLPVFIMVLSFLTLTILVFLGDTNPHFKNSTLRIMLLGGGILTLQWIYYTDFFTKAVLLGSSTLISLVSWETGIGPTNSPSSHAVSAHPDLISALFNKLNLIIIPVAFLAALILCIHVWRQWDIGIAVLLSAIAPISFLAVLGAFTPLMGGSVRYLLFGEVLLAATIAIGFGALFNVFLAKQTESHVRIIVKIATIGLIATVIVAQFGASLAVPDQRGTPRLYLTSQETSTKKFETKYIHGTIYSDRYYSKFVVNPKVPVTRERRSALSFSSEGAMSDELRNATIISKGYSPVTVRESVEIFRLEDARWYRLTWNQEETLSKHYHRIYDSGKNSIYNNTSKNHVF